MSRNSKIPGTLRCPGCGSISLYRVAVEVFNRLETMRETQCVVVSRSGMIIDKIRSPASRNPSEQRDAIVIQFACHACNDGLELLLSETENSTEIYWRVEPDKKTRNELK
jgi:hypothetical protein